MKRNKYSSPYDAAGLFNRTIKEAHEHRARKEKTTTSDSSLPNTCCYRFSCKCFKRATE